MRLLSIRFHDVLRTKLRWVRDIFIDGLRTIFHVQVACFERQLAKIHLASETIDELRTGERPVTDILDNGSGNSR